MKRSYMKYIYSLFIAIILIMIIITIMNYSDLPYSIPIHWSVNGTVNGTIKKSLFIPLLVVLLITNIVLIYVEKVKTSTISDKVIITITLAIFISVIGIILINALK